MQQAALLTRKLKPSDIEYFLLPLPTLPFKKNEQHRKTTMNAVEIESAVSDLAAQPFDAAEFPYAFLAAFGNKETTLKRLRTGNNNSSDVPGGVLLRNNIHIALMATQIPPPMATSNSPT